MPLAGQHKRQKKAGRRCGQALSVSRVICGTKVYQSPRQPLLPIVSKPPRQLPAQAVHRLSFHLLCPALAEMEMKRRTDQRVLDSIGKPIAVQQIGLLSGSQLVQRRYDEQYGAIDEIEVQIDDVQSQIRSIRQEKISGDNIYRLLLAFDQVYEAASEVERKEFMRAFIERIELFPEKQPDGNWIRKIIFNFPVPVNGAEVKELPLENETMVETVVLLLRVKE